MSKGGSRRSERGAALLTTLVATSALAVLAIGASQSVSTALFAAELGQDRAQAEWYVRGAEDYAAVLVEQRVRAQARTRVGLDQLNVFPIDYGRMEVSVRDAANCFNVNALDRRGFEDDETEAGADYDPQAHLTDLFRGLGINGQAAVALSASIADYVDPDASPRPFGAEAQVYLARRTPHLPAQGPIADLTELLAIDGVDVSTYRAIEPFLCAHDGREPSRININTLRPDQAPLLYALVSGEVDVSALARVIAERPDNGYRTTTAFWANDALQAVAPEARLEALTDTTSRQYLLVGRIAYQDISLPFRSLLVVNQADEARIVSRSVGAVL